ncbi:uncharacterized protein LOC105663765 isoform X1 [Megachile rotundata]|uniref:uncharacterized protein LOC105663765 isoform X1 n=1 Tax=Megachile rotundata TaxID=143995 RepID=UPI003FCFF755
MPGGCMLFPVYANGILAANTVHLGDFETLMKQMYNQYLRLKLVHTWFVRKVMQLVNEIEWARLSGFMKRLSSTQIIIGCNEAYFYASLRVATRPAGLSPPPCQPLVAGRMEECVFFFRFCSSRFYYYSCAPFPPGTGMKTSGPRKKHPRLRARGKTPTLEMEARDGAHQPQPPADRSPSHPSTSAGATGSHHRGTPGLGTSHPSCHPKGPQDLAATLLGPFLAPKSSGRGNFAHRGPEPRIRREEACEPRITTHCEPPAYLCALFSFFYTVS